MALWYDSKRHEYASDGKNGWFQKYCEKLVGDLKELCEAHFKGISNRHNARDVDYDEEMTVRDKLDGIDNDISETTENLQNEIDNEISERKAADTKLEGRIDAEQQIRELADGRLENDIKSETAARRSADTDLGDRIDAEESARQEADAALGDRINDLDSSKADKGIVTKDTIDNTITPGIYDCVDCMAEYKKTDGTNEYVIVDAVIVSTDTAYAQQTALCDADNSYFCILTRLGRISDDINWSSWKRLDEDIFKRINNEASAREAADAALGGRIDAEESARQEAYAALGDRINDLASSKADKGSVTKDTIDNTIKPGIYGAKVNDVLITYRDSENSEADNSDPLEMLIVAQSSDGRTVQMALLDSSCPAQVIVKRTKSNNGSWNSWTRLNEDILKGKAPTAHASADTTYGVGNAGNYGHLKLSNSTNSTSGASDGYAATPSAVKQAYDLAKEASKIKDGAVTHTKIAENSVWEAQLGSQAVTNDKIANGSVSHNKIEDGAVITAKIFDGAVTNEKIAGNSITHDKLRDDSVWENHLAKAAVTTEKIADKTVTKEKLADAVRSEIESAYDLASSKADKGIVTKDTIDNTIKPGIYDCVGCMAEYKKTDGAIEYVIVDAVIVSTDTAYAQQTALCDADNSYFCILTRLGRISDDINWSSWKRLDEDIYKLAASKSRTATLVVAASNSSAKSKAAADYVCDGTDDQTEINNAINALPAGGGEVVLLEGTYACTDSININKSNVTLEGMGRGCTTLTYNGSAEGFIYGYQSHCTIHDMTLKRIGTQEQNGIFIYKTNAAYCLVYNIEISGFRYGANITQHGTVGNHIFHSLYVNDCYYGINVNGDRNTVHGCRCVNNAYNGINIEGCHNHVYGNYVIRGTGQAGDYTSTQYTIYIQSTANHNDVSDNLIWGKNYTNDGDTTNTFTNNRYQ